VIILASTGYVVETAANGADGLLALDADGLPDCIVLDVDMPALTGPEMAGAMVRHDHGQEKIPILLVSGRPDLAQIADRVGTPYFLTKGEPGYPRLLLGMLAKILEEKPRSRRPAP
jgi:CheY-like chemotaxis protein